MTVLIGQIAKAHPSLEALNRHSKRRTVTRIAEPSLAELIGTAATFHSSCTVSSDAVIAEWLKLPNSATPHHLLGADHMHDGVDECQVCEGLREVA